MAQKRIKMVRSDSLSNKIRLLYDDGSQGELNIEHCRNPVVQFAALNGLTLKQAKMKLGIKS